MSDYGGESWPKKVARWFFWEAASAWLGERVETANVLCLSGPDAADARCARSFGFDVSRMVTCDLDAGSIASSSLACPGPVYFHGDVATAAKQRRRSFDVVLLDFCGTVSGSAVQKFVETVAHGARDGAAVGIGVMYGRERPGVMARLREIEKELDSIVDYGTVRCGASELRAAFIDDEVKRLGRKRAVGIALNEQVAYVSSDANRRGVPMLYSYGVRLDDPRARLAFKMESASSYRNLGEVDAAEAVRGGCLDLRLSTSCSADAFNLPESTVRAWRAVETRRQRQAQATAEADR